MIPCEHERPADHGERCHLCNLYLFDPDYRALWDRDETPAAPTARRDLPCLYRGADLRDEQGKPRTRACAPG